jgi:hypothetical protein
VDLNGARVKNGTLTVTPEMPELSEKQIPVIKIISMREEYQKKANSGVENSFLSFRSIQHCLI